MRVRKFLLENEKGQQFDMNNYRESCFLTAPTGLGYSNKSEFGQIGNTFIEILRKTERKDIGGIVNFKSYDKCKKFIDFIEQSNELKFTYMVPFDNGYKTYYRDVIVQDFQKTERQARVLSCPIIFNALSLWYEENTVIHTIEPLEDEIRWNFRWDSKFSDYNTRSLSYINQGHIEAPILVEISGYVQNPEIDMYIDGELYQSVPLTVEISQFEKLLYGTKENDFHIKRQKADGTTESLFNLDVIDFYNDNVIRIPKNRSCEIRLTADNEILNAKVTILTYYKAV